MDLGMQYCLRTPTAEEIAQVARMRARWHPARKTSSPHQRLGAVMVALAAMVAGFAVDSVPVLVIGTASCLFMFVMYVLVQRHERRERAAQRGPWDLPEGWRVRETTIRGRAVIAAGSDDEDYITWLVFELDGAEWYALQPSVGEPTGASLARAELMIASIEPDGPVLSARASGEPLPRRGGTIDVDDVDRITAAGEAYAKMVEAGFVWCPDRALPPAGGLVPADELPSWMRD